MFLHHVEREMIEIQSGLSLEQAMTIRIITTAATDRRRSCGFGCWYGFEKEVRRHDD